MLDPAMVPPRLPAAQAMAPLRVPVTVQPMALHKALVLIQAMVPLRIPDTAQVTVVLAA